jgi:hypothetical protein
MGYDRTSHLTAIGDTVNTASRLETLTKEFAVELVVSEELLARAGLSLASHPCHDTWKLAVGRGAWQYAPSLGQTTLKFPTSRHFIGNKCTPNPVSSTTSPVFTFTPIGLSTGMECPPVPTRNYIRQY